ncbi:hypothetical protein [Candidatus Tisiphia endosymbiont of Stenodema calcarata]|uniref:hypothetical protein n=1 Tax=Candidatus Tisiphia endosymbiont of Stenodema calcarata TaxID=3139337 RepID=UPI003CCB731A
MYGYLQLQYVYTITVCLLDFLHKSKIVEGFLEETKPSTAAYTDVREERRRISTTKSPTRLIYAGSLLLQTKRLP